MPPARSIRYLAPQHSSPVILWSALGCWKPAEGPAKPVLLPLLLLTDEVSRTLKFTMSSPLQRADQIQLRMRWLCVRTVIGGCTWRMIGMKRGRASIKVSRDCEFDPGSRPTQDRRIPLHGISARNLCARQVYIPSLAASDCPPITISVGLAALKRLG